MNFKKFMVFSCFIAFIMIITRIVSAEEPAVISDLSAQTFVDHQFASKGENDTQWAWGEVTNLDAQAKTFTLKYLDYDTDQERDLVLVIDGNTVFENIKSLDEIKINDTLSIDYLISSDGKNVARNINFEKPDLSPVVSPLAVENTVGSDMPPVSNVVPPVAPASAEAVTELSLPENPPAPLKTVPLEEALPGTAPSEEISSEEQAE